MTTVSLLWIGDLNQDKRMVNSSMKVSDERFRPKLIELKEGQDEIRIGRLNSTNPPNYLIESCINKRMISRNHATIERLADGGFMLYDHSMNGTYVNFKRVTGGVTLNQGDIVCFGHLNGANLKPGDTVPPFYSDLKYKVYIGSPKDIAAAAAAAAASATEAPSELSTSGKRQRKPSGSHETKKVSEKNSNRHRSGEEGEVPATKFDAEDSDEDLMDRLSKRKSTVSSSAANVKRTSSSKSNGLKRHASPNPSSKKSKHHSKKSRSKGSEHDADEDADECSPPEEEFEESSIKEEDQELCSARVCKQPAGSAIDWIQCDMCAKWYHQICLNLTREQADEEKFYCPSCKKKR